MQAAWLSQVTSPVGHGRRVNQQFRIFCTSRKQAKQKTQLCCTDKVWNSWGFWLLHPAPYPSHPLLSALYAHFLYSIQTFVGPAVRAAVRVLLWHLPRVAFIIWLAQKALLSPCTATPTAARNELCIDFLFAILTALTLFLLQPAGAVERHEEGEEKVEQSERPHFDRDKRNKCAIGR